MRYKKTSANEIKVKEKTFVLRICSLTVVLFLRDDIYCNFRIRRIMYIIVYKYIHHTRGQEDKYDLKIPNTKNGTKKICINVEIKKI